MADEVAHISVDELQANPLQPRGVVTPESLVDLIDSIKEHGILEPLVVAKTPAGYQLIAGERRWRAAKYAGMSTVPCVIRETTPQGMLELAIVENVQRVDLNPLDRAKGFQRLRSEFGLSPADIALRIGKSSAYVANSIRLLTLPDALKDGLLSGLITEGHARGLAAIRDEKATIEAYKILLQESGTVRRAEDLARRTKARLGKPPKTPKTRRDVDTAQRSPPLVSEETDKMAEDMQKVIADPTGMRNHRVKLVRSLRETTLLITLKGGVEETDHRIKTIYKAITSLVFA